MTLNASTMRVRPGTTVLDARTFIRDHRARGVLCPCCDNLVKVYSWTLLAKMAATLIWISRQRGEGSERWVHLNAPATPAWIKADRSYPKLVHWGLLEARGRASDSTKRCSGYWRITPRGRAFVRGKRTVSARVNVCNNRRIGRSEEHVTIHEALKNQFDYDALLRGEV